MKKHTTLLTSLLGLLLLTGACGSTVWEEIPQRITTFLNEYFPLQSVSSYQETDQGMTVELRNSAKITFDTDCQWVVVDGRGGKLPAMFINDCLPPALLQWLQDGEWTDSVLKVQRTATTYIVTLPDTQGIYDIAENTVSES